MCACAHACGARDAIQRVVTAPGQIVGAISISLVNEGPR